MPVPGFYSKRVPARSIRTTSSSTRSNYGQVNYAHKRAESKAHWNKIEKRFDARARDLPGQNQIGADAAYFLDTAVLKAGEAQATAEGLYFIGLEDLAQVYVYRMYKIGMAMRDAYINVMYDFWHKAGGRFNHGQIAIYQQAYRHVLNTHAEKASFEWPYVDPWEYVDMLQQAFDYDVWDRAFSDVTEAPLWHMQALQENAQWILEAADGLSFIPLLVDIGDLATAARRSADDDKMLQDNDSLPWE